MLFLNQNPFIRVIIPFIAGIICSSYIFNQLLVAIFYVLILLCIGLIISLPSQFITYPKRWLTGIFILLLFFFSGMLVGSFHFSKQQQLHENITEKKPLTFIGTITDDVEVRNNSVKSIINTQVIIFSDSIEPFETKILAYFYKDSASQSLQYGDKIIFHTLLQVPEHGLNPYEFNYRQYLAHLGINHTAWIGKNQYRTLDHNAANPFIATSIKFRNQILQILQNQLGDSPEYQVAAAIVAGYRTALDSDLRKAFSNAGAMHVMCVSGLHVGIIFLIMSFFLKFLSDKITWQRILKVTIILLIIWSYALITGFSASVLRASTMFSFVAAGMLFQRKIPIYNSLAASAIFLLILNPGFLFQIGFQLSYFAVIGIVALHPHIRKLIPLNGAIGSKISDLIAVSVAAQIATAPISMHYFHQFPNYFLITNLVVVPLAGVIIYTAIPALIFSSLPGIGNALAWLLGFEIQIMNNTAQFVDKLPGSVSDFIFISFPQVILVYLMIFFTYHGFITHKKFLRFAFYSMIGTIMLGSVHAILKMQHHEFVYPHGTGNTFFIASPKNCTVVTDDISADFQKKFLWKFKKYLAINKLSTIEFIHRDSILKKNDFFLNFPVLKYQDINIFFMNKPLDCSNEIKNNWQPNIIIIENNPYLNFENLNNYFKHPFFVFTTNNKRKNIKIWESLLNDLNIKYHNIMHSGAFIVKK